MSEEIRKVIRTAPDEEPKVSGSDAYLLEDEPQFDAVMLSYQLRESHLARMTGYPIGSEVLNHILNDGQLYTKIRQAIQDAVAQQVEDYITKG